MFAEIELECLEVDGEYRCFAGCRYGQYQPGRANLTGKINGWKHILNALTIHYGDASPSLSLSVDMSYL